MLPITPRQMASTIEESWARFVERKEGRVPAPHPYVYASGYRECERRMVLDMTQPDQAPRFKPDVLARFRRGNDREDALLGDLAKIGRDADPSFDLVGQQERFELKDRKGRIVIVGKVDARLRISREISAPVEVKSWAPQLVDRIERFDDLFDQPWTKSGAYQLLSYLYATEQSFGFILLDRPGLPLPLPVELNTHLDRVEDFLSKAERANDHREAETLPDFLQGDSTECRRCPFYGTACQPPLVGKGMEILTDPELEADLVRWHELRDAGREFDRLDKKVKKQLRGIESGIAGPFHIEGKWGKQSKLDLPPDVEKWLGEKYRKTDPKGRFTIEISKLGEMVAPTATAEVA